MESLLPFDIPKMLIAQYPRPQRDMSRMMVVLRKEGRIEHLNFRDIVGILKSGDILVLNDTKVIKARIKGKSPSGGNIEFLLVSQLFSEYRGGFYEERWRCLVRPSKRRVIGKRIELPLAANARILERDGTFSIVSFNSPVPLRELMEKEGELPLPPYIKRKKLTHEDYERYQSCFASKEGSIAAPTASLHFTWPLLNQLINKGIEVLYITLHIGPLTFLPVRNRRDINIFPEYYEISPEYARIISKAREDGRRVIAVGTTVVRTLEYAAMKDWKILNGYTDLIIRHPFEFRVVDALLTNFHLPFSTNLMLVSAFCGEETVIKAYRMAIDEGYMFYSYGDCMLII